MSPDEKFTYADLAYLRHVFQQYILIDTESTVASLTPTDVENFQKVAREGRPFSYEFVETFQAIPERSSHKVGRFDFCPLRCSLSSVTDIPIFLQFLQGILSLDISSGDLSTLLGSNNPILNSWLWSLSNSPSPNPFLEEYMDEYRARLGEMMKKEDGSSGTVERLYAAAHDQDCMELMCSNLLYDLAHSSPWASDAGLEERHKELAAREAIYCMDRCLNPVTHKSL